MLSNIHWKLLKNNATRLALFLAFYTLFHSLVENFVSEFLVTSVFSVPESNWINDIILILFAGYSIFLIVKNNSRLPSTLNTGIIILILLYSYYRFISSLWLFTPFKSFTNLKYLDIIPIIGITALIRNLFLFPKPLPENKDGFNDDKPITILNNDTFGYSDYAKQVATKIDKTYSQTSFAIGINGEWGNGKTSFINLIKLHLKETVKGDYIQLDFKPWNSNNPKAIIEDFFDTLRENLRPQHTFLAKLFSSYSKKLLQLSDTTSSKAFQTFVDFITPAHSTNTLFERINADLKIHNKKIIVYIDDLDRLDKDEIIEVVRLIRNTANFYNAFFIVAYDRAYITSALKKINDSNVQSYLEKIFQLEITLPYYNKSLLKEKLLAEIEGKFPQVKDDLTPLKQAEHPYEGPILEKWLSSIRDITRVVNSISLNFEQLIGEVYIVDFIKLELLNLKYPQIYKLLHSRQNVFFKRTHYEHQDNYYILENEKLNEYINKNDLIENELERNEIIEYISNIFGDDRINSNYYNTDKQLAVKWPHRFRLYFAYSLLKGHLSEVEFNKTLTKSLEEIKSKISEWIEEDIEFEVYSKLKKTKIFKTKEDFEKLFMTILYFIENCKSYSAHFFRPFIDNIALNIDRYPDWNIKDFIKNILDSSPSPFTIEAAFVQSLSSVSPLNKEILTKKELESYSLRYLRQYCNSVNKFDRTVWDLFRFCRLKEWERNNDSSYSSRSNIPKGAYSILQNLSKIDFNGLIKVILEPDIFNDDKEYFKLNNDFVVNIFDDWDTFKSFMNSQDESKHSYLKEFKDFFIQYEAADFKNSIKYKFTTIDLSNRFG